ncbi:lanthionine synthetase LanC family protein [Streptomyces tsukubensis]|uniref:lanthionine synthetase LanC family protein n=1 Tax=Streptomyces tsukubensis TaxID=83656 RepID=UPI00344BD5D0
MPPRLPPPPDFRQPVGRAVGILHGFTAGSAVACDPGIPVLAALVAATDTDTDTATGTGSGSAASAARRAVAAWVTTVGRGPGHPALYNSGLAGTLVGLHHAAALHPPLLRLADRLRGHLLATAGQRPWRTEQVALPDYDLISGPSGTLLALYATAPAAASVPAHAAPFVDHLVALCDSAALPRLRTGPYENDPDLHWLHGRINTGTGHGVAGLTMALTAAVRRTGPEPRLVRALRRTVGWLVRQSFTDDRSVRSWAAAGHDGTPPAPGPCPRQAWCYGNPGVTWALWDAADALGDERTAAWAATAFTTLADAYDPDYHLYGELPADRLGICHGAAGVLAVADAFARHARLPAAAGLRTELLRHLEARLPELDEPTWHPGLLGGTTGVLAALLTAGHGASRSWLICLGLR